jgi:N6-L-threonylcarbamoyladenine synthase/protein kinase Bud32
MISLGLEGTAHTLGVGIVSEDKILANVNKTYTPASGGIHPREAARYIADNFGPAVREAFDKAGIDKKDVDVVSFSQGPGLGPCLSNVGVGARALALSLDVPIIGVNHCVAHIEIGNMVASKEHPNWAQPLVLYVSGGNTQIIMFKEGRYRVFGETLDVGVGNMLDKFGRSAGLAHPAGPKIEELARNGKNYIELPYVVKGNDLSFSGLFTESLKKLPGNKIEDVCYSLQETAFAMMTEATERALCHLKSESLLLTGGVANNKRLQEMLKIMADDNGAMFSVPKGYCGDNGAMIAWTGLEMFKSGVKHRIEDTAVDQDFRTDEVDILWAGKRETPVRETPGVWKGAEAVLSLHGGKLTKERVKKAYRIPELDEKIRKGRTTREPRLLASARAAGVMTPVVFDVLPSEYKIVMDYVEGDPLYKVIDGSPDLANEMGLLVRRLHDQNIIHGDLTTSNIIVHGKRLVFIDFGLGGVSSRAEDKATDLLLLKKALNANHPKKFEELWGRVLEGYGDSEVLKRLEVAEQRGRYL